MNYYQRHLGDYARDTAHLTLLEHGVYTLLLDRYYATEQPIPADQAHRVARAKSKDERAAVDSVLAEFFTLTDGAWVNGRAQAEIEKAQSKIEAARANGQTGGRPKKNPEGTQQKPTGFPVGTQEKALQSPISNLQPPPSEPTVLQGKSVLRGESSVDYQFVQRIKAIYPAGHYSQTHWLNAQREMGFRLDEGVTLEQLQAAVEGYARQQDLAGNSGSKFIRNPASFFADGYWRGPFEAPLAAQKSHEESPMDRIRRLNTEPQSRVIEHG